jgi:hypothetical protein
MRPQLRLQRPSQPRRGVLTRHLPAQIPRPIVGRQEARLRQRPLPQRVQNLGVKVTNQQATAGTPVASDAGGVTLEEAAAREEASALVGPLIPKAMALRKKAGGVW